MKPTLFVATAAISISCIAQEPHRCRQPNGSYLIQDTPCKVVAQDRKQISAPTVQSSDAGEKSVVSAGVSQKESDLERQKKYLEESIKARKKSDLKHQITNEERELERLVSSMNAEIVVLRDQKKYANNNLAGATWEQSISVEMQAVTSRYQIQIDAKKSKISSLRTELDSIK